MFLSDMYHELSRKQFKKGILIVWQYLGHSSLRASVKCRFGPLRAGFDFLISSFSFLSAGFALLSAGFPKKKDEKKDEKDEKIMKNRKRLKNRNQNS